MKIRYKILLLLSFTLKISTNPIQKLKNQKKDITPRKLMIEDQVGSLIEHHIDKQNILGGIFGLAGGELAYESNAPTFEDNHNVEMIKSNINEKIGKSKMLSMERGTVIHDINHFIGMLENEMDFTKSKALDSIYAISAVIDSSNQKQAVLVQKYKSVFKH